MIKDSHTTELPSMDELRERKRRFIEDEGPWNNGGKQECCAKFDITMTHDELAKKIGPTFALVKEAGFMMMPKKLYEAHLEANANLRKANAELSERLESCPEKL